MAQSLLHVSLTWLWFPSLSPLACLPTLPVAPLHLLPIPGPAVFISVLSGASSSEPPHLQHEEPGAQGCSVETDDQIYLESNELPFFISTCLVMQIFIETRNLILACVVFFVCLFCFVLFFNFQN